MPHRIHNFTGNLIAFYRPIKRTYFFLKWFDATQKWHMCEEDHPQISLHKSTAHDAMGEVNINVHLGRSTRNIHITADRCFLKSGPVYIPIVKKTGGAVEGIQGLKEYIVTMPHDAATYEMNTTLWMRRLPQAQALPIVPVLQAPAPEPMPQRIAWLIAEDASKRNEICPITQDEISPITACVTTCFHVFNTEAFERWAQQRAAQVTPCPMCRKGCSMTIAYLEAASE
jgi:hypothetical protein